MDLNLELELEGWKVKAGLVALALLVVLTPLALIVKSNRDRAEDWHRRAVVAEESVTGLRMVIVARSRELNRRTLQANQLAGRAQSNGAALRQSKVSVGALSRRQRELASENARMADEGRKLRSQLVALEQVGSTLSSCAGNLGGVAGSTGVKGRRTTTAVAKSRAASCKQASARFNAYLEHFR